MNLKIIIIIIRYVEAGKTLYNIVAYVLTGSQSKKKKFITLI
jgi:hypothetical protein